MVVREEFYFEPRVINDNGYIRWYGERYTKEELLRYLEETVYIRDSGEELFVYQMESDQVGQEQGRIQAVFTLIYKLKKGKTKWRYGKKIAH